MIQVTELRIGNYLNIHGDPSPIGIGWFFEYSRNSLPPHEPIPLTPEILGKCGFEYGETIAKCNSDDVNSQAWSMQISNLDWLEFQVVKGVQSPTMEPVAWPEWRIVNEFSWIRQDFWGQPTYLHQLQNLYFALTGEELEVTL